METDNENLPMGLEVPKNVINMNVLFNFLTIQSPPSFAILMGFFFFQICYLTENEKKHAIYYISRTKWPTDLVDMAN